MKMICPKSETCKRDYCGVGKHCDEHERKEQCEIIRKIVKNPWRKR